VAIEREAVPAAAHHAKRLDWQVAAGVVTYGRVVWVIHLPVRKSRYGCDIHISATRGMGVHYPLPDQHFLCLPGQNLLHFVEYFHYFNLFV
jgi:hypothetical protein